MNLAYKPTGGSRPVEQIHPDSGEVLTTYPSLTSAAKATGQASITCISGNLSGKKHTAGGFVWREPNSWQELVKPVDQLDTRTGGVLKTFASIVLAADTLGIASPTQIADVCNGRGAAMGGFSWRFAKGKKKQKLSDKKQLRF